MIGIFDSGVGGLTVLSALRREIPTCDVIYFGDSKHAPYGEKSPGELSRFTVHAIEYLHSQGARKVVSACNSVSASLAASLFDTSPPLSREDIVEMVGPTASQFRDDDRRLAVCATPATIQSRMYQNAFRMLGKEGVEYIAVPGLAGAIEAGASHGEMREVIEGAFAQSERSFDVLILACTHYALVADVFLEVFGNRMVLYDPSTAVAVRAREQFGFTKAGNTSTRFVLSEDSDVFRRYVNTMFSDYDYSIEVLSSP